MTKNKPIYVDGVDVSTCEHITYKDSLNPMCGNTGICCYGRENCIFKQLARLQAEDEELKANNETWKTLDVTFDNGFIKTQISDMSLAEYSDIKLERDRAEQKLKRIREVAKQISNECFYDNFDCKDCDIKNGCTYLNKSKILQIIDEEE